MSTQSNQFSGPAFAAKYLKDLHLLLTELNPQQVGRAIDCLKRARESQGTIFICGNGGSASIASQMVVDMVKCASFKKSGPRFKMIGLTDSISTITAYANDEGYERVFEEPLRNFARSGDVLIAISGSGNSQNVLNAVKAAEELVCHTIGLTTTEGGKLKDMVDIPLLVPSTHMGRLEDCFFIMTHILCYYFIENLEDDV